MAELVTIHVVFNAHLDPIWLWPLRSGIDEAVATCRSACDRLDRHADLVFTRGEAWVYEQVEQIDPCLFERIRAHVRSGRWEIVGGWYIQPDCNQPSGFALEKQIEIGKRYFLDRFGIFPDIAYNVDSFGHCATLPSILSRAGQKHYVMMRPQANEMDLPASMFRWREKQDADEVLTLRIPAGSYATPDPITLETLRASLRGRVEGVPHTVLFAGIGDHGGGATEEQIRWLRENAGALENCRLVFSSPSRFFAAVALYRDLLPIVTGELQHHAVGCYSIGRDVKTAVRRAEHALAQAETVANASPDPDTRRRLDEAWRLVCFHHFHDTLGGTCLPSAYRRVLDDLGAAASTAEDVAQIAVRRLAADLEPDPLQRIIFYNAADTPFGGYVQLEPWLERTPWPAPARLLDEENASVHYQIVHPEANMAQQYINGLLFHVSIAPQSYRTIRIDLNPASHGPLPAHPQAVAASAGTLIGPGMRVDANARTIHIGDGDIGPIDPESIADNTDTWAHGIDRFPDQSSASAKWTTAAVIEPGPLRATAFARGAIGRSTLNAEWCVHASKPFVELRLRVCWFDERQVLKLVVGGPFGGKRLDGIPGGSLERPNSGRECPLRDWTLIEKNDGRRIGIVCPAVFAVDCTVDRLRLTLLRSAVMAHHEPFPVPYPRATIGDLGVHAFSIFFFGGDVTAGQLEAHALIVQRPPLIVSSTNGMPCHPTSPKF